MEDHLKTRPSKKSFPQDVQIVLRERAIDKIKHAFFPNPDIEKIILIGSSVKGTFGEYEAPGFRGSLFSDFDFIFIVDDNYKIPEWLDKEPDGKPFPEENLNLAYRNKCFIEEKYDCEFFFIHKSSLKLDNFIELAEKAGIPLKTDSRIKHLVVYPKEQISL